MENFDPFERPKTHVEWVLGNKCNYNCSYCHSNLKNGDRPYPSQEIVIEVCKEIIYHYDELGRDVVFNFIGGEPTLAGHLGEVGKRLSNHPVNMIIRTNGSASLEWWEEAKDYLSEVIISVHREFCNIGHIDNVIRLLQDDSNGHSVKVKILIPTTDDKKSWSWAISTLGHFQKKFNLGELQLLYSNFTKGSNKFYNYSPRQWDEYNMLKKGYVPPPPPVPSSPKVTSPMPTLDVSDPVAVAKLFPTNNEVKREVIGFKGYRCHAGIDTLIIDSLGLIFRGYCSEGGPIGSIYELPITWPTESIICGKDSCDNGFDRSALKEIISSS